MLVSSLRYINGKTEKNPLSNLPVQVVVFFLNSSAIEDRTFPVSIGTDNCRSLNIPKARKLLLLLHPGTT